MPITTYTRHVVCTAAFLLFAGCTRENEPEPAPEPGAVPVVAGADSIFAPAAEREALPRERIYYTLTDHAWYARGEPLVHEGRSYQPQGAPVGASVQQMRRAGEFQGVEYYIHDGNDEPVLYVPVFEGYWLPFRPDSSRV